MTRNLLDKGFVQHFGPQARHKSPRRECHARSPAHARSRSRLSPGQIASLWKCLGTEQAGQGAFLRSQDDLVRGVIFDMDAKRLCGVEVLEHDGGA